MHPEEMGREGPHAVTLPQGGFVGYHIWVSSDGLERAQSRLLAEEIFLLMSPPAEPLLAPAVLLCPPIPITWPIQAPGCLPSCAQFVGLLFRDLLCWDRNEDNFLPVLKSCVAKAALVTGHQPCCPGRGTGLVLADPCLVTLLLGAGLNL